MSAIALPRSLEAAATPIKFAAPPYRVKELQMAAALAAWFQGDPWSLSDAMWQPYRDTKAVRFAEEGDTLTVRANGNPPQIIATRFPASVTEQRPGLYAPPYDNAIAVARIGLRLSGEA